MRTSTGIDTNSERTLSREEPNPFGTSTDRNPMSTLEAFNNLPDTTDCWLYAANRELSEAEITFLSNLFMAFEKDWSTHGRSVRGAFAVAGNRIVIVAAHVEAGDISGCGIDKSLHFLQEAAASRGFEWSSALNIVHEDSDGALQVVSRGDFKKMAKEGVVTPSTRVVDLSIRSLGELRNPGLLRRASDSWHVSLLPDPLLPVS